MDNACSEYIFVNEFFTNPNPKRQKKLPNMEPLTVFNEIFDATLKYIQVCLFKLVYDEECH